MPSAIVVATPKQVDYENELMIVMGRRARDVKAKDALKYVFGYTVVNDVSARDHQFSGDQFSRSKSFDTFMPVGPWIVDTSEIPNPQKLPDPDSGQRQGSAKQQHI